MSGSALQRRLPLPMAAALVVGLVGWSTIAWLAVRLFATTPPSAGFDLELLLRAGRLVAAGTSPYDQALLAGTAPGATSLFYSYPPPVAQLFAVLAPLSSGLVFLAWSVGAVAALLAVGELLRRRLAAAARAGTVSIALLAAAALTFPFTIAVLFGNLDAFFPALYGLVLVAAISPQRSARVGGGLALAIAATTKLYPAGLGLWFAVRSVRDRSMASIVAVAIVAGAVTLLVSLVVGGLNPWRDYATVIGVVGRAELLDPNNIAPAALVARLLGGDSDAARVVQVVVAIGAVVAIVWAALKRRDPVESLAIAATATFVLLPVTWVHYPAALIPFGVAALLRSDAAVVDRTRLLLGGAIVIAVVSLAWLPLLWVSVGLTLAGVHASAPPVDDR